MAKFKAGDQVKAKPSALADYPQLVNQVGSVYSVDRDGISVEFDGSLVDGELVFLPHELIKVKSLPAAETRVKALRGKWGSKAMITNKVRAAVSDMGFSVSAIQDREDGCFVQTDDPRQLRPMYQFLENEGFDARLKADGVFVADTGYTGR